MSLFEKAFIEELDGLPAPYTLQQLKDSYQLNFPLMAVMVLPGIAPLLHHANIPEEQKQAMKMMAMDKMIGLLNDFLEIHENSMQKFPEFFDV